MLFLRGEKSVLQTVNVLTKPYQNNSILTSFESLKTSYNKLITEIQPWVPHSKEINTEFITDLRTIKKLMEVFSTESLADDTFYDMEQSRQSQSAGILGRTKSSILTLGERHPGFSWVFNLVMNSVFNVSSKIASGGTTSAAVGVLFIDPRSHYTDEDMYELLVHELGHTLLFLHEWRFGLFNDVNRLTDPQTFALSAIRNQMRPFDKAIHSVLVAIEVLLLRDRVLGHYKKRFLHPPTNELIPMVNNSIKSISETDKRENMLTDFGKDLLAECRLVMENYNKGEVKNVVSSRS